MSRQLKSVKSNPLASRIKKVMQADEDVGKIAQGAPVLVSRAVEMFLANLCEGTADIVSRTNTRTATPSHLKAFVTSAQKLDFLADKFTAVPDFVEDDVVKEAPAKKQRSGGDQANSDRSMSSPPSSSGRSGRSRGRTRGRGSTRITAQDTRAKHVKNEHVTADSDIAMPDSHAQQVKQEVDAVEAQQPGSEIKVDHTSTTSASASVQQPLQDALLQLQPKAAALSPDQPLPSKHVGNSAQVTHSTNAGQIQQEKPHMPTQHVEQSTHAAVASFPLLPVGFSLPKPQMAPEEDDYDADE